MFCPQCGSQTSDKAANCPACGAPLGNPYQAGTAQPGPMYRGPEIPTYLAQSILVTIFCCWVFGIPAIVYAAKVGSKLGAGDYEGARQASDSAKMWCWIAVGSWLVLVLIYAAIFVFFILLGEHAPPHVRPA